MYYEQNGSCMVQFMHSEPVKVHNNVTNDTVSIILCLHFIRKGNTRRESFFSKDLVECKTNV